VKKVLFLGFLGFFSTSIQAQESIQAQNWYAGLSFSHLNADLETLGATADSNPSALNLNVGYSFNQRFAIEALYGTGLSNSNIEGANFSLELENVTGLSAVGIHPISDTTGLYGKLGFGQIDYADSDGDTASGSGVLFGGGVAFDFSEKYGLNLDLLIYPDAEYDDFNINIESRSLSFGAYIKF